MSGGGEPRFVWAGEEQFSAVRDLWHEGFPEDTDEDVTAFWRAMSGTARCLLCMEGERAVSMAFLLPADAVAGEERLPLWYVYAAATCRDRRGQGLFGRLLNEAAARAAQNGVEALFLRPAEPSLFAYYARQGFQPLLRAAAIEWKVDKLYSENADEELQEIDTAYAAVRRDWLKRLGGRFVDWSPAAMELAVQMAKNSGGGAVFGPRGTALCEREGDRLLVRELLCAPADRCTLAARVARYFPCQSIVVNAPAEEGEGEVFGMLRPCGADNRFARPLYMGFTLE